MNLSNFLTQARESSFWSKKKALCFTGSQYPLTFFSQLFDFLKKEKLLCAPYQRIFIDSMDKKEVYSNLSQSILGNYSFFWLGDIGSEKKNNQSQKLIDFLLNYQGPHVVSFFISHDSKIVEKKKIKGIEIPDTISYQDLMSLMLFFQISFDRDKNNFLKSFFVSNQTIKIEVACNVIKHLALIGSRSLDSMASYLCHLIDSPPTLNVLSEQFFAKQPKIFFTTWNTIRTDYSDMFWITFWSGQLWKAHNVTGYLKQKNFVAAKQMSYRLPFTFINKYWKLCNQGELVQAYQFLYSMDYAIKTGSITDAFDLFFMNYFEGRFK